MFSTGHDFQESMFFLAEMLTVFQWGWLSDRYGRKPVLLLGPLGLSFAMLGFGLSKSFWSLVTYRCLQGVFNGNIGTISLLYKSLLIVEPLSRSFEERHSRGKIGAFFFSFS